MSEQREFYQGMIDRDILRYAPSRRALTTQIYLALEVQPHAISRG